MREKERIREVLFSCRISKRKLRLEVFMTQDCCKRRLSFEDREKRFEIEKEEKLSQIYSFSCHFLVKLQLNFSTVDLLTNEKKFKISVLNQYR